MGNTLGAGSVSLPSGWHHLVQGAIASGSLRHKVSMRNQNCEYFDF